MNSKFIGASHPIESKYSINIVENSDHTCAKSPLCSSTPDYSKLQRSERSIQKWIEETSCTVPVTMVTPTRPPRSLTRKEDKTTEYFQQPLFNKETVLHPQVQSKDDSFYVELDNTRQRSRRSQSFATQ